MNLYYGHLGHDPYSLTDEYQVQGEHTAFLFKVQAENNLEGHKVNLHHTENLSSTSTLYEVRIKHLEDWAH
jgi:hypothetical protein